MSEPPRSLRQHGRTDERRHLTVLFSDLCGSTRLGHTIDPELLDEVLQHVTAAVFPVIAEHGGTVVQFHGDGVLAVFGHPDPGEDDVRKATEAALDLHEAVRALDLHPLLPNGFELRMHSGIDSGVVLVQDGDEVLGRLKLVGDPPNTAAGLAGGAGVDEILATRQALLGSLPFFEHEEVPPVALKGVRLPVAAYRVDGRSGITRRFQASERRGLIPFIGRSDVLDRLHRAIATARTGRFTSVRVVGDAGIGKTRTCEEFLRSLGDEGIRVFRGECESQAAVAPLWPFQQIVRSALGLETNAVSTPGATQIEAALEALELTAEAPELLAMLNIQPTGHLGEAQARGGPAALAALVELLERFSRDAPIVVFFDDWQWSDDTSRSVAGMLAPRLADQRILWLTATRPSETRQSLTEGELLITLEPFGDLESAQAIDALAPGGLDLGVAGRLHQRSGGNPLFLEELCRSLAPGEASGRGVHDVPPTLHGLIENRVHALDPEHAEPLRVAAVIGNVVPLWLLTELTGLESDAPVLADLAADDLLYPGAAVGTLRFKHGITRDVVYHSVRLADRRRLHALIAETLDARYADRDGESPLETLAYHYEGAADYERACHYAERAGDRAWASAALDRARQQYGAALAALDHLGEDEANSRRWLAISKRRAFACVFNPASEQLEMLARAAAIGEALGDSSAIGHAHFWHGFISFSLGRMTDSIEQYHLGLEVAERAGDAKLIAQLRANLGESRAATCEYDEAIRLLDESIESKRRLQSKTGTGAAPTGTAFAIAAKGFIAIERGDDDGEEGHRLIAKALDSVRGTGHPVAGSCLAFKASGLVLQGRFSEALEIGARVEATGERVNGPYLFGRGRSDASFSAYMQHGALSALELLRSTTDWLEEREIRLYISLNFGCLAEAMFRAGRLDLSRRYAERALERADQLDPIGEGMACRAMARLSERESPNQPERADSFLDRAMLAAKKRGSTREIVLCRATEAELLAQRGERDEARERLSTTLRDLERMRLEWYAADARRLMDSLAPG